MYRPEHEINGPKGNPKQQPIEWVAGVAQLAKAPRAANTKVQVRLPVS